jgi:hypothetical protein
MNVTPGFVVGRLYSGTTAKLGSKEVTMQNTSPSTIVVTAALPGELHEALRERARENLHSLAAELRVAVAEHVGERVKAGAAK